MNRLLPVLTSVALLLGYGLAEGFWSDRWSLSTELAQAPARLATVPSRVGEWQGEDGELDPRQARQGDIRASLVRRYVSRRTGEALNVLLVCGRPGPIALHSPQVCLGGSGFELQAPPRRKGIAAPGRAGEDTFWAGRFHKPGVAVPEVIEVYWSWNAEGDWQAVDGPRLFFARRRALYKLYVSRPLAATPAGPEEAGGAEQDPIAEFLGVFLPEVRRCLFAD